MKFAIHTLGCKVNQYEAEQIIKELKIKGGELVDFKPGADLYIINTCYVTAGSEKKSRQLLNKAKRYGKDNGLTVFTGCYAKKFSKNFEDKLKADLIVFQENKDELAEIIGKNLDLTNTENMNFALQAKHTRALLKIQDGCSSFCTYCAVPLARGLPVSKPSSQVIEEARQLIDNGVKEIVITGINLGLYGPDLKEKINLKSLLENIVDIPGAFRIRLSSIEPFYIDKTFIKWLSFQDKICRHLHIPLQSGSNRILKEMKRPYKAREFVENINFALESIPGLAISTDIMVGFPGESEKEFIETLNLIKRVHFRKLHIFRYSPRPGTKAFKLEDSVAPDEKKRRSDILLKINMDIEESFIDSVVGGVEEVLVEKENKNGFMAGWSDNYIRFKFKTRKCMMSSLLKIKAVEREGLNIIGQLVND